MPLAIRTSRITLASLTTLCGLAAGLGLGLTHSSAADSTMAAAPVSAKVAVSGRTIIDVTGNAANGFALRRLNGRVDHPPTRSEARAECKEYRSKVKRVRCRVGVNRWYADLAVLRDSIDFYQRLLD